MAKKLKIYAYLGPTYNGKGQKPFSLKNGVKDNHKGFMYGVPLTFDFKPVYFDHSDFHEGEKDGYLKEEIKAKIEHHHGHGHSHGQEKDKNK